MVQPDPPHSLAYREEQITSVPLSLLSALLPLLRPNQQNVRWMSANNRRPRPRYHYLRVVAPQKRHFGQMSRPCLLVAAADRHTPPYTRRANRLVRLPYLGAI